MTEKAMMRKPRFPPGWDEDRMREILSHFEDQPEDERFAEIEAVREVEIPNAETSKALRDADAGMGLTHHASVDDMFKNARPDDTLVDDLLESNPAFRALVEKSKAGPSKPFPVPEGPGD
jgi:hypothetical protein